ncbi:hypothetical protein DPMN_157276 [Dreissena polymorpha]|uniref:Uncharacterized protein n=1 Tax=Dreissena polymorpha TaxID=45954 RepID=A0A9D4EHK7_DREPO|nr:hypothetical protein DPMN_157276 [Dreissena polymorpha]
MQGILKVRDSSPPFTSDYDVSMEGYDSRDLDLDLEEDWDMHDQLPQQLQPRSQVPKRAAPVPAKRIDVSPARGPVQKGSGVVPKLKLGLEDVDEEEPVRLQQTGETTGEIGVRLQQTGETTGEIGVRLQQMGKTTGEIGVRLQQEK